MPVQASVRPAPCVCRRYDRLIRHRRSRRRRVWSVPSLFCCPVTSCVTFNIALSISLISSQRSCKSTCSHFHPRGFLALPRFRPRTCRISGQDRIQQCRASCLRRRLHLAAACGTEEVRACVVVQLCLVDFIRAFAAALRQLDAGYGISYKFVRETSLRRAWSVFQYSEHLLREAAR